MIVLQLLLFCDKIFTIVVNKTVKGVYICFLVRTKNLRKIQVD